MRLRTQGNFLAFGNQHNLSPSGNGIPRTSEEADHDDQGQIELQANHSISALNKLKYLVQDLQVRELPPQPWRGGCAIKKKLLKPPTSRRRGGLVR
jgi:hypothetical protein